MSGFLFFRSFQAIRSCSASLTILSSDAHYFKRASHYSTQSKSVISHFSTRNQTSSPHSSTQITPYPLVLNPRRRGTRRRAHPKAAAKGPSQQRQPDCRLGLPHHSRASKTRLGRPASHYGIDDLPLCHPRQRQISRKTHLGLTAVKKSLFVLREKGLISWKNFASRRNNYSLTLATQHQPSAVPIAKTT